MKKINLIILVLLLVSINLKASKLKRNFEKEKAFYNDFILDKNKKNKNKKTKVGKDVSKFGKQVNTVIKKHQFKFYGVPYSIQGIPIFYTSESTGFNLGLKATLYDLKNKDPYRYSLSGQFWASDEGYKRHKLTLKIPSFFSKNLKLRMSYEYKESISQRYFSIGNNTNFNKDFIDPKNSNYIDSKYYKYNLIYPSFKFDISFNIPDTKFFIFTGLGLEKAGIETYGTKTLIVQEKPTGISGGNTNYFKAGLKFDSRDYEINPNKGFTASVAYTKHTDKIKSDYNYTNLNLTQMSFFPLGSYITFAQRIMIEELWGNTPFFALNEFKSYDEYRGLGGENVLRGAPEGRFVDDVKFISQIELRIKFYKTYLFKRKTRFIIIPFWDFGRVWDKYESINFSNLHHSFGSEFRMVLDRDFIASFTLGFTKERVATYLSFGETFN
jgi:hypothetical protein